MTVDKVETTVANLSGGERARLLLNIVAMERPHLLILDEPTNHLDIDSRRALTEALNDYAGAVILITHDRSLMELVADRLWLVADGTVKAIRRRHGRLRQAGAWTGLGERIGRRVQRGAISLKTAREILDRRDGERRTQSRKCVARAGPTGRTSPSGSQVFIR